MNECHEPETKCPAPVGKERKVKFKPAPSLHKLDPSLERIRDTTPKLPASQKAGTALRIVLWTLLATSAILLPVYHFRTYRAGFHSDGAFRNIVAAEILRTGQFFPPQFVFVNDIPVFNGHIFIALFALFGANPNTYFMNALSGFIDSLFLIGTVAFLFKIAKASLVARLLGFAVIMSGVSERLLEMLYGQNAYGPLAIEMLLPLGLAYVVLFEAERRRKFLSAVVFFFIAIAVMSMSGPRGLITVTAPLSLTVVVMAVKECRDLADVYQCGRRAATLAFSGLLGTTIGTVVFLYARHHTAYVAPHVEQTFASVDEIGTHIGQFLSGSLYYFGALPIAGRSPYSIYGLFTAYRLPVAIFFLSLPFFLLFHYKHIRSRFLRFALLFYLFEFISLVYFFIFGHVAVNIESYRYFANALLLLIVIASLSVDEIRTGRWRQNFVLAVIVTGLSPLLLSAYAITSCDFFHQIPRTGLGGTSHLSNPHDLLAQTLAAHGLRYGYATYWNAAVTTVLSNGASQVRQVLITSDGKFLPFRHLASRDWYRADYYRGPTFLIVADDEVFDRAFLQQMCGPAQETIRIAFYTVLVFPFNVASRLPGWD